MSGEDYRISSFAINVLATVIAALMVAVIIGAFTVYVKVNGMERTFQESASKPWVQGQFNTPLYRLDQLENRQRSNAGRLDNLTDIANRVCERLSITCSTRNALWYPPAPFPRDGWLFAHYALQRSQALVLAGQDM